MNPDSISDTLEKIFSKSIEFTGDFTYDSVHITSGETKPTYDEFMKVYTSVDAMRMLREGRDKKLSESDWVTVNDISLENENEWIEYRQALRDIPSTTEDLENPTWPETPKIKIQSGGLNLDRGLQGVKNDLFDTQTQLGETRTDLQTIHAQFDETQRDLQTTHTQLEETRSDLTETQTQLQTTCTHLEGELQTTRTQLGETRTQLGETRTDLQTTRTQLETTRTQLGGDLQSAHNQLQNTRTELEITNLKLRNAEARIGTLEQTMTSILSKLNV